VTITRTCPTCGHKHEVEACEACHGRGQPVVGDLRSGLSNPRFVPCNACGGTGEKHGLVKTLGKI
jgi:DnaJ-class molecular chaperone